MLVSIHYQYKHWYQYFIWVDLPTFKIHTSVPLAVMTHPFVLTAKIWLDRFKW